MYNLLGKHISKNYSWLFFGQVLSSVANILCLGILIKCLGSNGHGIFVVFTSICYLIGDLANFQSSHGLIHFLAKEKGGANAFRDLIGLSAKLDIFAGFLALVFAYFFIDSLISFADLNPRELGVYSFFFPVIFIRGFNNGTFSGVLKFYSKFTIISISSILTATFKIIAFSFLLIKGKTKLEDFLFIELSGEFLRELSLIFFSLSILKKKQIKVSIFNNWKLSKKDWQFLKFNFLNGFSLSMDLVLGNFSNILISRFLGVAPISFLRVIERLGGVFIKFTLPLEQIFYPKMCGYIAKEKKRDAWKILVTYSSVCVGLGGLILILAALFYDLWAPILLDKPAEYFSLSFLYLLYFVFNSAVMPIHGLMLAMGLVKYNAFYTLILNSLYLLGIYKLLPEYGLIAFIGLKLAQAVLFVCFKTYHILADMFFFQGK